MVFQFAHRNLMSFVETCMSKVDVEIYVRNSLKIWLKCMNLLSSVLKFMFKYGHKLDIKTNKNKNFFKKNLVKKHNWHTFQGWNYTQNRLGNICMYVFPYLIIQMLVQPHKCFNWGFKESNFLYGPHHSYDAHMWVWNVNNNFESGIFKLSHCYCLVQKL